MTQTIRNCESTRNPDSCQQGLEGTAVRICIDGNWIDVPASALIDPCQAEQLAAQCRAACSDLQFAVSDPLSLPDEALNAEFRLGDMNDKVANIAPDMNRMDGVQEGLLKALTSGEPIQVNRKNRDPITMRPTAKLVFATNALPTIVDRSEGIWRRMIAMPFNRRFDESNRDRLRATRLKQELPGIFNWALEGARRLYAQDRFTECSVCQACLDEHRLHSDPFRQFVDEELQLDPAGEIAKSDAYQCYRDYCVRTGNRPKNNSEFGKQMYRLEGVSEGRAGTGVRQRSYRGVRLARHRNARHQAARQKAKASQPQARSRSITRRNRSVAEARAEVQPGRASIGTTEVRLVWRAPTGEFELTLSA